MKKIIYILFSLKKILLLAFIIWQGFSLQAQTDDENLQFGDNAFAEGDYYSASIYYQNILQNNSSNLSIAYKYAEACRLFNDYKEAEKWYSHIYSKDKKNKFPYALFYLALMNKSNGDYVNAKNNFSKYYQLHKSDNDYFSNKSQHEIESCLFAIQLMNDTLPVRIDHLNENVNTPYSEFNAKQIGDSALIYSSVMPTTSDEYDFLFSTAYLGKILKSKISLAGWAKGNELKGEINNPEFNNVNAVYTNDRKRMYFTRCATKNTTESKCEIYVSENSKGKWQIPVKLTDDINLSGYSATQPTVQTLKDNEREVLYFVSDRPGGYGGNDIWYTVLQNGKYSEVDNAGEEINTPGNEISPFFDHATQQLYFSSDWHKGLGGYDIFKTEGSMSEWTTPKNIGFPINTSYNDMFFTVNEIDSDGYLTSNRPGSFYIKGETCCNDIWSYEWLNSIKLKSDSVIEIQEPVIIADDTINYEQNILDILPLTLYFHNNIPNPASRDTVTLLDYKTTLLEYIQMKERYEMEYSQGLTGEDKIRAVNDIDEFFENYVATGFNKLEQFTLWLLKELQKGKNIRITIKGYCSPLQTTAYNINLAKRRISSLKNYFKNYNNGVFIPYINGTSADNGKLEVYEDAIGKAQANPLVSDNPHDAKNSIFSRGAALERKIQIIMYQSTDSLKSSKLYPQISFTEEIYDLGIVAKGAKKIYSFSFQNIGNADLIIAGVESDCGCVVTDFPKEPIMPGERGQINILFDSADESGKKVVNMVVYTNTRIPKKELSIISDVQTSPVKQ